ncbi:MAG: alpha/beta hydrolase [Kangiellaceae bacterium]
MLKNFTIIILFLFTHSSLAELKPQSINKYPHGLDSTIYHTLESKELKREFHLFVKLPKDYKTSNKKYPVIYLLDGGLTYPLLASYHTYLSLAEETPQSIIVGISYGTSDFKKGNRRSTDFTAKAKTRDYWGGAKVFQNFLKEELLPIIENTYPADPSRRIIFGQSIGGQFVLYTVLTQPDLFWGHIASNPALHRNLGFYKKNHSKVKSSKARLFVSSGSNDDPKFKKPAGNWIKHWNNLNEKPWALKTEILQRQNHFSAAPESFRQGLKWIYEP